MTPKQITRLRARHNLSKVELADLLGQSDNGRTVYSWESGEFTPSKAAQAALRYVDMLLVALAAKGLPKLLRMAIEHTMKGKT